MKKIILTLTIILVITSLVNAQEVCVDFFYGRTCPHCAQEEVFLESLEEKYPELKINKFEIHYNEENKRLFQAVGKKMGASERVYMAGSVPTTVVNGKIFVGFSESDEDVFNPTYQAYIGNSGSIERTIQKCIDEGGCGCVSEDVKVDPGVVNGNTWIFLVPVFFILILIFTKAGVIKVNVNEKE